MSLTMHIVRKDVRRLAWVLALWLVVLTSRVVLSVSGANAAGELTAADLLLQRLSDAIQWVEMLLAALIVARLVHEEPLVGLTAFWLTRPYDRARLLRAKLLFALVMLVGLPLLADLATMVLLDARNAALVRAGSTAAVFYVAATLSMMALATLTSSIGGFVLTILGIVTGIAVLLTALVSLASLWPAEAPGYTPPQTPDVTRGLVMFAVYLCAALSVVVYQYFHRRWRVATGLAVAGLAATVVIPMLWPWSFARSGEIRPGAWAASAVVVHDPSWGTEVGDVNRAWRGVPRRRVNARVTLSGTPPQITVNLIGMRSRLRFTDGTTVESSQASFFGSSFRNATVEAALGGARLLSTREVYGQGWAPMITLTEEEFTRHRGRAGRFEADVDFHLQRTREIGALPLTRGAALDDGVSRIEILGVQRRSGSRDVTIRRWRAHSLISLRPPTQDRLYALRHRARGEALMGGIDSVIPRGRVDIPVTIPVLPLVGAGIAGDGGFSSATTLLRFPGPGFGKTPALDPAWFDEAEFVVLDAERAGVVTRRLAIDEFVIPAN